uniref:Uncharacterized protein n=3 Tax=Eptatretus burgeri TaxID=7764 RepID=A0A8C4NDI2_EPTBU
MGIYSFKMKSSRETLFSESEMEGLEKRFKMMVQNPLMKPKVQTIFSSAEFSMLSAQCESSRLSWETIIPHSPASARRAATFGTDSLSPVYRPRGRVTFTVDEHPICGSKPVEGKSETLQSPVSLKDSPSVVLQPADTVSGSADPADAALPQSSGISSSTTHQLKDEKKNIETDLKMTPKEISFGNAALQNDGQCPFPAAGLDSGGGETEYTSDALLRSHSIDQLSCEGLTKSLLLPKKKSKGIQESQDIDCDVCPQLSSKDQVDHSVGFISDSGQTRNAVERMNERGSSPEQGDASSSSSRSKRIDERGTDVRPLISQHHEEPRVIDLSLDGTELKDLNVDDDLVCEQSGSEYSTNVIFDDNEEGSETEEMFKQRRDIYCISCKKPISALDKLFGCHELHDVTTLDNAARLIKVMLNENMMVLKDRVNDIKIWQESLHDQHKAVEKQTLGHKQELMFYFEELMDMLSQMAGSGGYCAATGEAGKAREFVCPTGALQVGFGECT